MTDFEIASGFHTSQSYLYVKQRQGLVELFLITTKYTA